MWNGNNGPFVVAGVTPGKSDQQQNIGLQGKSNDIVGRAQPPQFSSATAVFGKWNRKL